MQLAVVQVLVVDEGDTCGQLQALRGTERGAARARASLGSAAQPAWSGGTEESENRQKPGANEQVGLPDLTRTLLP